VIFRKPFSSILTRGFTLIEVLIALAVFAAVGVSLAKKLFYGRTANLKNAGPSGGVVGGIQYSQ